MNMENTNTLSENGIESEKSFLRKNKHIWLAIVFVCGAFSTTFYFFNFIGLIIGVLYFLFLRNSMWGKLGLLLTWTVGITTIIINGAALINSTGAPSISTTYLAILLGPLIILAGGIITYSWQRKLRYKERMVRWFSKIENMSKNLSKKIKSLIIFSLLLFPSFFWGIMSLNLCVLFDNDVRLLWVHAPSTVKKGTEFDFTVESWDLYERLSATYKGKVKFSLKSYDLLTYTPHSIVDANLPGDYTFSGQFSGSDIAYEIFDGKDNGLHDFSMRINTAGIHYIIVNDSITKNVYWSNPILVKDFLDTDPMIYWGDLHCHSALSDGSGTPEHHFYYARYIACLDFNALTDHGETMGLIPGGLDTSERVANSAYEQGRFVTFPGIEWTNAETGHFTCIFSGDKLIKSPLISFMTITTPQQLWSALDDFTDYAGCRALALPHHTIKEEYPQDWTYINPKYVKIVEVTSVHGESLFEQRDPYNYVGCGDPPPVFTNGTAIMDAFKMGYRLGLYASSDEHDGHPGHSLSHTDAFIGHQRPWTTWINRADLPYPGSLTAVYATQLTRNSVFDGLYDQRVYANSDHGRPILKFSINGVEMGGDSKVVVNSPTANRNIEIFLAQDGAPAANKRPNSASVTTNWVPNWNARIEIFKNGKLFNTTVVSSPINKITLDDDETITGTSFEDKCIKKADGNYYINEYSDNPIVPSELNTGVADFYLVRVVGDNGRMSYIGPIWVEIN